MFPIACSNELTFGVKANTGFEYHAPTSPPMTIEPDAETLALLRGRVTEELAETYPHFAATLLAEPA